MAKVTEKLSFAEMQQSLDARKNNSDLENLASAMMQIKAERQEIKKELLRLETLEKGITELANRIETGDLVDVSEVSELYNSVRSKRNVYL